MPKYRISSLQYLGDSIFERKGLIIHSNLLENVNNVSAWTLDGICFCSVSFTIESTLSNRTSVTKDMLIPPSLCLEFLHDLHKPIIRIRARIIRRFTLEHHKIAVFAACHHCPLMTDFCFSLGLIVVQMVTLSFDH